MKHNAHVIAYKKAIVNNELSNARRTIAKWALQTKCGIKY